MLREYLGVVDNTFITKQGVLTYMIASSCYPFSCNTLDLTSEYYMLNICIIHMMWFM
jgi:hypothetical protein